MTYLNWRKSTYSLANGNCVEVGTGQGMVAVRDSTNPDGPAIEMSPRAWIEFIATCQVSRETGPPHRLCQH
jgi:hypothetical protein